jgi:hypothetical protein
MPWGRGSDHQNTKVTRHVTSRSVSRQSLQIDTLRGEGRVYYIWLLQLYSSVLDAFLRNLHLQAPSPSWHYFPRQLERAVRQFLPWSSEDTAPGLHRACGLPQCRLHCCINTRKPHYDSPLIWGTSTGLTMIADQILHKAREFGAKPLCHCGLSRRVLAQFEEKNYLHEKDIDICRPEDHKAWLTGLDSARSDDQTASSPCDMIAIHGDLRC